MAKSVKKPTAKGKHVKGIAWFLVAYFFVLAFVSAGLVFFVPSFLYNFLMVASKLSLFLMMISFLVGIFYGEDMLSVFATTPRSKFNHGIKEFLLSNKLYVANQNNLNYFKLPEAELTCDAVKIEVLSGLREKLLQDSTLEELQAFLDKCGTKRLIQQSYYKSGWVYYVTVSDIEEDRLWLQ